ncbi:hypothetical protein [Caproiciproducens sp.]|uniref:hypothetical protein n=1 Tax=Caproiciproducens sp. TaxID=1954376 RepID=UPI00289D1E1E|nr:hypothetical protein [Caproiciproducens sp.]
MENEISEKIRRMLKELGWSDEVINNSEYLKNDNDAVRVTASAKQRSDRTKS